MNRVLGSVTIAALAVLAGCGARLGSAADNDGGAPQSDLGSPGDLSQCVQVVISPPSAIAPAQLIAEAQVVAPAAPIWSVLGPSGLVSSTPLDQSGLRVSVDAIEPGTYLFRVEFAGGTPCPGQASAIVMAPQAIGVPYRLRLTPPASSGLPQQDLIVPIYGKTPQTAHDLVLVAGTWASGILRGPGGLGIPGEVLLVPDSGPEFRTVTGTNGSFSMPVSASLAHRVVLIPDDPALAPHLLGPLLGANLFGVSFAVAAGLSVIGLVRDPALAPISGTAVSLRKGSLPSGLGVSAGDGSYALRAEAGTYSLAASAPGWPDLTLDAVDVASSGQSFGIDHLLARLAVSVRVVRADGSTPVPGARVSLRSTTIPGAAMVTSGVSARAASGVMNAQGITAAGGILPGLLLPAATYDVLVEPPSLSGGLGEARTGQRLTVSTAGELVVELAPRVSLNGHVRDQLGDPIGGARVRALSRGGVVSEGFTSGSGAYSVPVDAGVPLEIIVTPPTGSFAAAQAFIGVAPGGLGGALGVTLPTALEVVLPPGVQLSGRVTGPSGSGLGGVAVDVLCLSCSDPRPLAHSESSPSGGYVLHLPDPGTFSFDAGTD